MVKTHNIPVMHGRYTLRITTWEHDETGIPQRQALVFDGQYAFASRDLYSRKWLHEAAMFAKDAINTWESR
jgi:hypothetical protein